VVPVHAATSMDAPNPDAGEKHPHTTPSCKYCAKRT
jgi:hypothetical protein